jgi:folate-binding protein YgfZ
MIIQCMTSPALNGVAALPHLGVIRAVGPDAASFLNGQLTNDFALLGAGQARLAAYCTAKGRMLASFIGLRRGPEEILLVCSRDLLATTLRRLSMFVLRAKVKLADASEEFALYGLAGSALAAAAVQPGDPWTRVTRGETEYVHLYPADGQPRVLCIAPVSAEAPVGEPLAADAWLCGEVRSGVATLSAPVVEAFVPQMLNYESIGGVNFKKGCYPGQEVVARSQFRGTLKRRAFVAHVDGASAAGQDVFEAADAEQPAGTIVQSAPAPGGGFDAIVSLQLAAAERGSLTAGSADGPRVTLQPLPYRLVEDV